MTNNKFVLLLLTLYLLLIPVTCTPYSEYTVNRDEAIAIALNQLPETLAKRAGASTLYDEDTWTVALMFSGPNTFTREELGWEAGPETEYENRGILPEDSFQMITIKVDRLTGDIVSKHASDNYILLGGPGVWNNEPLEKRYPVWVVALAVCGGVLLGALVVWLIIRRKEITRSKDR